MATALLVVRHGVAVHRRDWSGDDDLRPLTAEGERQAKILDQWLARQPFPADPLLSSPTRRCLATLEPLAARTGRPIEHCDELRTGRDDDAVELARRLLAAGQVGVLSTHGEVVPGLLAALAPRRSGPPAEDTEKGSVWLLRRTTGAGPGPVDADLEAHYLGPDRLAEEAGR